MIDLSASSRYDAAGAPLQPLLARTLRGLEALADGEIRERLGPDEVAVGHRELRFATADLAGALELGVADDVFLIVHEGEAIGHVKAELARLAAQLSAVDLDGSVRAIAPLRRVHGRSFDISASFLGARNYSRFDLEDAAGAALAGWTGWEYRSRRGGVAPGGDLSLRVHVTRDGTTAGVRLAAVPLHRRAYRVASRPGALHPPLARALVRLADPAAVATLLDPFCGTGTIAIEAKLWGASLDVRASDLEADAVDAARQNAEAAGVAVGFAVADAAALSVADGSAGCIVTNPPWGIRVEAHGGLASGLAPFWESADSALGADGHIAVLAPGSTEPGLPHVGFEVVNRTEVRVSGALAQLVVYARR